MLGQTGRNKGGSFICICHLSLFPHDFSLDIPHKLWFVRDNKFYFVPISRSFTSISLENLLFSPSFSLSQAGQLLRMCITRLLYQLGTKRTVVNMLYIRNIEKIINKSIFDSAGLMRLH